MDNEKIVEAVSDQLDTAMVQIADALGTVEKTVKVHRARVMAKMAVRSVTALVRLVDRARHG